MSVCLFLLTNVLDVSCFGQKYLLNVNLKVTVFQLDPFSLPC